MIFLFFRRISFILRPKIHIFWKFRSLKLPPPLCLVIITLGQTKWDYSSDSSPPVLQYMAYQAGQPVVYGGWCSPSAKVGCLFHFPKSLLHLFLLLLNYCLCKRSLPVLEKSSVICFIAATQPIALSLKHCNKDFLAEEYFCKYNKSALSYQNR